MIKTSYVVAGTAGVGVSSTADDPETALISAIVTVVTLVVSRLIERFFGKSKKDKDNE